MGLRTVLLFSYSLEAEVKWTDILTRLLSTVPAAVLLTDLNHIRNNGPITFQKSCSFRVGAVDKSGC